MKKEIIADFENGFRVSDFATQYDMIKSTISTFQKNKNMIKAVDATKGVSSVVSKQRQQMMDKFIKEKEILFTNPSTRAGYDTRSIFKQSLTGLDSEFSFT